MPHDIDMKCESCNINKIEIEEPTDPGQNPFRLCRPCHKRLLARGLRPLEFFNLTAIHGHTHLLHDDFYDDFGQAQQPEIKVDNAKEFPFPVLQFIKSDFKKLVDFATVQYFTSEEVIQLIKDHDKQSILNYLDQKVNYNNAIRYKAYEIAARALGPFAADWIRKEWNKRTQHELNIYAIALAFCLPFEEAFEIVTGEIEKSDDRNFLDNALSLLYFQNNRTLNWIEKNSSRIKNISTSWGTLAAASQFDWHTANRWLTLQRPLSLIALDALYFCTTTGDRQAQALWLRENNPALLNAPAPDIIANRLQQYLTVDNVPRTKSTVNGIINNIFETTSTDGTTR